MKSKEFEVLMPKATKPREGKVKRPCRSPGSFWFFPNRTSTVAASVAVNQ